MPPPWLPSPRRKDSCSPQPAWRATCGAE
jgi:hypothetical protein